MKIESPAFSHMSEIPLEYTCDGVGANMPLVFSDIPAGAKSLVLIVDDPDAPSGNFTHWVVWNITPDTLSVRTGILPSGACEGINSSSERRYVSPCPPNGTHRYFFKLFALDTLLALPESSDKERVVESIGAHVLESAELLGTYSRKQ